MSHSDRKSRFSSNRETSPLRVRNVQEFSGGRDSDRYDNGPYKKIKDEGKSPRSMSQEETVDLKTETIDLARENPLMEGVSEANKLENFKISSDAVRHMKSIGITYLFPIQAATYEHVYEGRDLIARDKTGSGKTLSYALPIVERFRKKDYFRNKDGQKPFVLVVLPTRELVIQVTNVYNTIKLKESEYRVLGVYGGTDVRAQVDELRRGVEIVIGTPGRLMDLIERKALSLSKIRMIVLDEADHMLDMGFQEDIEKIYDKIKEQLEEGKELQSMLFSATIPDWVHTVSKKYLREDLVKVDLLKDMQFKTPTTVKHLAVNCPYFSRNDAIGDIVLCYGGRHARTIIFTEKKKEANDVMMEAHIKQECQVLHGDIPQKQREITFRAFREGKFKCLIATNVAARGLDIPEVDLIVQLEPPKDVDTYIHRAGRTARAGRTGVCVTFYTKKQVDLLEKIERKANFKFQKVGAPQPLDIIKATSRDVVKSIKHVPHEVVGMFKEISQELVKDLGAEEALCRALAIISGTNEKFKQRSLLTSVEGFITYLAETDTEFRTVSYVWGFLKRQLPSDVTESIKGMRSFKNRKGAAFDVPEKYEDDFNEMIEKGDGLRGWTIKKADHLPEFEEDGSGPPVGRFGGNFGGRFGGENRRDEPPRSFLRSTAGHRPTRRSSRSNERKRRSSKSKSRSRDRDDDRKRGGSSRGNDAMKVFVGGLSYDADEDDIKGFFKNEDLRPEEVILLKGNGIYREG